MTESRDLAAILAQQRPLLALARALSGSDADDLVQEALFEGVSRRVSGRGVGQWLRRSVISRSVDLARAERRRRGREARAARPEALPSTSDLVEREQLRRRVAEAVIGLAEPYRSTVWQRFFEDRSVREIAQAAAVPEKTVHTRLRRALAQLRGRLDSEYSDRRAWVALVPIAADTPGPAVVVGGVLMKKLILGMVVLVLLCVAFDAWWWRGPSGELPSPPAPAMRAQGPEKAQSVEAPAARVAVPSAAAARTVTIEYSDGRPAAHLECWLWPEWPPWTYSRYSEIRLSLPPAARPELFYVGANERTLPGRRDAHLALGRASSSTDAAGRATLARDAVGLTVRVEPHLLVTFDVAKTAGARLVLPAFAQVPVRFVGTRSDEQITLRCAPVFESSLTFLVQDVSMLTLATTTASGEAKVSIAAFGLRDVAARDLSFGSLSGVLHEITALGSGVEMREPRQRERAPAPFELVVERHTGGIEVAVLEADGTLARSAAGCVWLRSAALPGEELRQIVSGGTAQLNVPEVAWPLSLEVEAWLADGERFHRAVQLARQQRLRVELVRGTGEVRLAIELPDPSEPSQVLVETASGDLADCRDAGSRRAPAPGWLVASDGIVSVYDPGVDWRRILVVTRSGRIASVEPPAEDRIRAHWLPDTPLVPLDVAAYARQHDAQRLFLEFGIRLESAAGVEKWVWPDNVQTEDAAAAPLWEKWVPLGCQYRFGAQSGDRVLPAPQVVRR